MTKNSTLVTSVLLISSLCGGGSAFAQDLPAAPPLVKQINNGNWLSQAEAEAMRDELYSSACGANLHEHAARSQHHRLNYLF